MTVQFDFAIIKIHFFSGIQFIEINNNSPRQVKLAIMVLYIWTLFISSFCNILFVLFEFSIYFSDLSTYNNIMFWSRILEFNKFPYVSVTYRDICFL